MIGLVVAFSMSSTLAKKAESPGVLIAFWRMIVVSIVWTLLLAATGRLVRMADVRQVFIPGIFFGLNAAHIAQQISSARAARPLRSRTQLKSAKAR